jgi:hypothetical protein
MKGPFGRSKHDVRRIWECPRCHRRLKTGGEAVSLVCECSAADGTPQRTFMNLVEPPPSPRKKSQDPPAPPAE